MLYKASAPANLMLLGEYAVLNGKFAVVCALDKFIHVTLKPRSDDHICIESALGHYQTSLEKRDKTPPFEYVLEALSWPKPLPSGCDVIIESEFRSDIGFGSSAAVTVATTAAINVWLNKDWTHESLWQQAKHIIHRVRGTGSGADLAASIYGGVIAFRSEPFHSEPLSDTLPLTVVYSGKKTPTHQAIEIVAQHRKNSPDFFNGWDESMNTLALEGIQAIKNRDWKTLGLLFTRGQDLMAQLGVSDTALNQLIHQLQNDPGIFGAKISGAGLGDCVIGVGKTSKKVEGQIHAVITQKGLHIDHA